MGDFYKLSEINCSLKYPVVSAWEFEQLKKENNFKKYIKPCTIYLIGQRPLLYMNNLEWSGDVVKFDIVDMNENEPLKCEINIHDAGYSSEPHSLLAHFHNEDHGKQQQPFNNVAAFRIYDANEKFLVWYSPQKFIYEYCTGRLKSKIYGDVNKYIDYKIHYIGKSFDQLIWNRLKAHHALQTVLITERSLDKTAALNSLEISLIMLGLDSTTGLTEFGFPYALRDVKKPIALSLHKDMGKIMTTEELGLNHTNEVEALLISDLRPTHNDKKFKKYPNIKNGMRDLGYSKTILNITGFPVILKTDTKSYPSSNKITISSSKK